MCITCSSWVFTLSFVTITITTADLVTVFSLISIIKLFVFQPLSFTFFPFILLPIPDKGQGVSERAAAQYAVASWD